MAKIDWAKNTRQRRVREGEYSADPDGAGHWSTRKKAKSDKKEQQSEAVGTRKAKPATPSERKAAKKRRKKRKNQQKRRVAQSIPRTVRHDMVQCPICDCYCLADQVERHAERAHGMTLLQLDGRVLREQNQKSRTAKPGQRKRPHVPSQPQSRNEEFVSCPHPGCSTKLKRKNLQKHLRRIHGQIPEVPPERPTVPTPPSAHADPDEIVPCPYEGCTTRVKRKNLQKHITRIHETSPEERDRRNREKRKRRAMKRYGDATFLSPSSTRPPSRSAFQLNTGRQFCECGDPAMPGDTRCRYCSSS
jgi:hypothetical protein